jgi:hypothetical protein
MLVATLFLSLGWLALPSWADDWPAPHPVSFHSRGFVYVAEIFPPQSRQNPSDKPVGYFYEMGYPGGAWDIAPTLKWTAEFINKEMPYEAVVSMDGRLVTLNEWANVGFQNAVVVYDLNGKLVKSYDLDSLLPKEDMNKVEHSKSSRYWNRAARYYFLREPARLYVLLSWQKVLEFSLEDGKFQYGNVDNFPGLAVLVGKQFVDEEAEVWATNLRFSSITDVVKAKAHHE